MSAHNVYYVKCNVVLNNVIFDSCLFPHQHYDRHSFHARECCAIRQNVRGDKSSMAFNNHFAHYSLFSYSKSQGNSFSHTCCLYCPAYLTAVAFSDRTRHGMPDEMLILSYHARILTILPPITSVDRPSIIDERGSPW